MVTSIEVDPDAHEAAKLSGDYGKDPGAPAPAEDAAAAKPVIPAEDPGDEKPAAEPSPAEGVIDDQINTWTAEYAEKGELSAETRAAVKASLFAPNVSQDVVDSYINSYIEGMASSSKEAIASAHTLVGGTDSYKAMTDWAANALSDAEKDAFNQDATGEDMTRRDAAIRGLHARFQQSRGLEPDREPDLTHSGGRATGDPIIGSRQELVRIMRTDEYKRDPAVREKVERQLLQSMATGKYLND
jgi:hypothetical protein